MAMIAPNRLSDVFARDDLGSPKGRQVGVSNALQMLESFRPSVCPERPEDLELADDLLRLAAAKSARGNRLTKVEKESLALLGTWRAAVRKTEAYNAGNLIMLLGVINVLEAGVARYVAEQERLRKSGVASDDSRVAEAEAKRAKRQTEADRVRQFLVTHYRAELPRPAPKSFTDWAEKWADKYSQNREVLPLALRTMDDSDLAVIVAASVVDPPAEGDHDAF